MGFAEFFTESVPKVFPNFCLQMIEKRRVVLPSFLGGGGGLFCRRSLELRLGEADRNIPPPLEGWVPWHRARKRRGCKPFVCSVHKLFTPCCFCEFGPGN